MADPPQNARFVAQLDAIHFGIILLYFNENRKSGGNIFVFDELCALTRIIFN